MVNQSVRLKIFILPVSMVLTVILLIFYVKPVFSEMIAAKQDLTEAQKKLNEIKANTQKLDEVKKKWDTMGEDKTILMNALPEDKNSDAYISEITSKASRSGVLLTEFTSGQSANISRLVPYICGSDASKGASPIPSAEDSSGIEKSPLACASVLNLSANVRGSWEQILDLLKYLEDMNRISNIEDFSITSQNQPGVESADILITSISLNTAYKLPSKEGNMKTAAKIASQNGFDQKAISKIKETVFSAYQTPSVMKSGERNLFK